MESIALNDDVFAYLLSFMKEDSLASLQFAFPKRLKHSPIMYHRWKVLEEERNAILRLVREQADGDCENESDDRIDDDDASSLESSTSGLDDTNDSDATSLGASSSDSVSSSLSASASSSSPLPIPGYVRRGWDFARASIRAHSMESVAAQHYPYQPKEENDNVSQPTKKTTISASNRRTRGTIGACVCKGCSDFDSCHPPAQVLSDYQPYHNRVFVRISRRRPPPADTDTDSNNNYHSGSSSLNGDLLLIWEGFVGHKKEEFNHPFHTRSGDHSGTRRVVLDVSYALAGSSPDTWPEVQDFLNSSFASTPTSYAAAAARQDHDPAARPPPVESSFQNFVRVNRIKRKFLTELASNLVVTVMVLPILPNHPPFESPCVVSSADTTLRPQGDLLVSTGGCWFLSARDQMVYLQPRHKWDPHERLPSDVVARTKATSRPDDEHSHTNKTVTVKGNHLLEVALSFKSARRLELHIWDRP